MKKVYNPVDPILHRTESNTDIPAAILSVTNYLKENGVYHHIANKSKIELIRDQNKYTIEGVAFTDGGYTFNNDGSFKSLFLIKRIVNVGSISKDKLKEEIGAVKADYHKLIERKRSTLLGIGGSYDDQYFLLSGKELLKKFPKVDFEQFIPSMELNTIPIILLALPTDDHGYDELTTKYLNNVRKRLK